MLMNEPTRTGLEHLRLTCKAHFAGEEAAMTGFEPSIAETHALGHSEFIQVIDTILTLDTIRAEHIRYLRIHKQDL